MARLQSILTAINQWTISDKIAFANCVCTSFFLLATIISVICAFKAYKHQKERARKEAACNLARYYAENIINRHSFVSTVLHGSGVESEAKKLFPYDELCKFDRAEMLGFLNRKKASYEEIDDIFKNIDPQAILNTKLLFALTMQERIHIVHDYYEKNPETGERQIVFAPLLQSEFRDKICDYLNDLEWFSMSCRYGISDEEILYQSLHTTFLSNVWLLYFYISSNNSSNEGKLFTNIIWLFNKWHDRLADIQSRAEQKQAKAKKEIKAAEYKRSVAEQKLNNACPEIHAGKPLKK